MRRGIILPAVLVLISLLVLLALTRNYFSRQQLHLADMVSEKEQAYHIADGLRKMAVAMLDQTLAFYNSGDAKTFPKLEKADKQMRPFLEKLLQADGSPSPQAFSLQLQTEAMRDYLDRISQGGIEVREQRVELIFTPIRPLLQPAASGNGLQTDSNEIFFKIMIRCHVCVGNGRETLLYYREGRTINLLLPPFGKFSLFVAEPDADRLNLLALDAVKADGSLKTAPLLVNNGASCARDSLDGDSARDLIDRQGWVYLGETAACELKNVPGAALVNYDYFSDKLESGEFLASKGTFTYYYFCDSFRHGLFAGPDGLSPFSRQRPEDFLKGSVLKANGDASSPSPTVVIGRVTRSYPIVQGLAGVKSGLTFPFPMLSEAEFSEDNWPSRLKSAEVKMIKRNFDNDYRKYNRRMSFIYREAHNAANLQILKLGSLHNEYAVLQPDSLPTTVPRPPRLQRLQVNGNPAEFVNFVSGATYSLVDENSQAIYLNAALTGLKDLSFLKQKAVRQFFDLETCLKKLDKNAKNETIFPGAVTIESNVLLKQNFNFADSGAMIICGQNISIDADIIAPGDRLLTLVSLTGNISVTPGRRVDAALVAVDGEISLGAGCRIGGLVAARHLKLDLSGNDAGLITYRTSFDPTSTRSRIAAYRICPEAEEYYLVE